MRCTCLKNILFMQLGTKMTNKTRWASLRGFFFNRVGGIPRPKTNFRRSRGDRGSQNPKFGCVSCRTIATLVF